MDIHKIDWSAIQWKEIRKGVERKAFSGSAATVALHRLMPGHEPKPHSHPHEQLVYIVSGHLTFQHPGGVLEATTGDSFLVPGNVEHQASAQEGSEVLDIFTPYREDYA